MNNKVSTFWAIMAGAAETQSWFPYWVVPCCPRVIVPAGRDRFSIAMPINIDDRWHDPSEPIPASVELNEMTLHFDLHKTVINTSTAMDGIYEIGLGFLFLGDDPNGYRCGRGLVYCWQRKISEKGEWL